MYASEDSTSPWDVIQKLPAGRDAVFMMATFDSGTRCVASPASRSQKYIEAMKRVARKEGRPQKMSQGILSRMKTGTLILNTEDTIEVTRAVWAALCRMPGGDRLPGLAVFQVKDQHITRSGRAENLILDVESLRAIERGEKGYICVLRPSPEAKPIVIIDTDTTRAKARVARASEAAGQAVRVVRARVKADASGTLEVRSPKPIGRLVQAWVRAHEDMWPDVATLRDATFR